MFIKVKWIQFVPVTGMQLAFDLIRQQLISRMLPLQGSEGQLESGVQ